MAEIDDSVAQVMATLVKCNIAENTLVVFTSDNGTLHEGGLDNVGNYKPDYLDTFGRYDGAKLDMWDGGVRMPTFARWPSMIEAGSESTAASQFHDWMATFCDLSGIPAPAVSDGVSIVPTLTGKGKQARGIVYSEFKARGATPSYEDFEVSRRGRPRGQMQSVLIGDYKGVRVDIKALGKTDHRRSIENVTLLGHKGTIEWTQENEALIVMMPNERPCDHAFALTVVLAK